ncbi:MAG: hypothetical protein IJX06_01185 [Clostridia bacterium]|nr:hypothetical protein [Clostridia bacterium]
MHEGKFSYWLAYMLALTIVVYIIGRLFPRKWIKEDKFPFRSFGFEKEGKIYDKIKIKKWKTKYPDASLIMHKIFPKIPVKRLDASSPEKVSVLLKESCVAETTHVVAILLGFFALFFWMSVTSIILTILYALVQIPPIIIQRYNRPRLKKSLRLIIKTLPAKEHKTNNETIEEPMSERTGETISA